MPESVWEEIEAAVGAPAADRESRLDSVLMKLEGMSRHDPEVLFALGYALYFHPDRLRSPDRQRETEDSLSRVLRVDPEHDRARLYLGHHYYDIGRYREAGTCFSGIRGERLSPLLYLKARELDACCRLILEGWTVESVAAIDSYVGLAEQASEYDVLPVHLVEVVRTRFPESASRDLVMRAYRRLRGLIFEKDLVQVFAKDIAELDSRFSEGAQS